MATWLPTRYALLIFGLLWTSVAWSQVAPADDSQYSAFSEWVARNQGRSSQKNKTSLRDPRILMTDAAAKVFVGFAHKANQAEIMSWNQKSGRYDFFVIENLARASGPRLTKPDRQVCLSCHQGGGPIFPATPWTEALATPSTPLYKKMVKANGGTLVHGINFSKSNDFSSLGDFDDRFAQSAHRQQERQFC